MKTASRAAFGGGGPSLFCRFVRRTGLFVFLGFILVLALWGGGSRESGAAPGDAVSGTVSDHRGPVAGARVRIQGAKDFVVTDVAGGFAIRGAPVGKPAVISVWKDGYYCAIARDVRAPRTGLQMRLTRYQINDNAKYAWLPPEGKDGCGECHPALTEMSLRDAHLKSASNPRFLTMYTGTDVRGRQSPPTRYGLGSGAWKTSYVPQRPDPAKPHYGPGYVLDFPDTTGNCSACHVPGASLPRNIDPREARGADRYGVHCDFCHKVADVHLDPVTKMPFRDVPGVSAMSVRRPFADDRERAQLFFGSFEDVNADQGDTNLPLLRESRFCATCHVGVFWDTLVYNSYGEWLTSAYADPHSGQAKTCQECHMPSPTVYRGKAVTNVAPGKGGIERDPAAIHSHDMTVDEKLLREALTMTASVKRENGRIVVTTELFNDRTGHHVPTDTPLRHLILLVDARDAQGTPLRQLYGPVLPDWCGKGNRAKGHYAGLPGTAYAKLLREKWTEIFPTGAYWNHTEPVSDNRLAAFARDRSSFTFAPPARGKAAVTVTLLYRRAFIGLMEQKGWDVPDIVMARERLTVR